MKLLLLYSILLFTTIGCQSITYRKIRKSSSCVSYVTAPQIEKDIVFLENYILQHPKKQEARYLLAMRYYRQQNLEKSIQVWNDLININPQYALAIANRGVCYYILKQEKAANADFRRAVELGFDEPIMNNQTLSEYLKTQPIDADN